MLYVESMVASLERGDRRDSKPQVARPGMEAEAFANHQLTEACIVVIDEATAGLALAKRAITAYLESNGEKLHLANVPFSLQAVRGGLRFLEQERAAELIGACADFIQKHMLESNQMPRAAARDACRRPDQPRVLPRGRRDPAARRFAGQRARSRQRERARAWHAGRRLMSLRWQAALLDPRWRGLGSGALPATVPGRRQRCSVSADWLKRLELPLLSEQGWVISMASRSFFELDVPADVPARWQGLRQFMQQVDPTCFACSATPRRSAPGQPAPLCGSCGSPMHARAGERAMYCPACGVQHYPRLSPSMIVLVTRGDELLLARSPRFAPGVYSTLAGYVEPGESVEQCVAREVREEVGVDIHPPQYIASQGWPFPHSLMLGFHAEYAGGEIVPQPEEIEDARWFHIDNLPALPARQSIARYLIELYLARRLGRPEPVLPG